MPARFILDDGSVVKEMESAQCEVLLGSFTHLISRHITVSLDVTAYHFTLHRPTSLCLHLTPHRLPLHRNTLTTLISPYRR